MVATESDTWRCARWAPPRDVICGKGRHLADDEVFFRANGLARGEPFGDQECVGSDTQARVMMESAPTPAFIVAEPELLLEVLVVALDAPAHVGLRDQIVQGNAFGEVGQVILEGLDVARRPFDQQPLFRAQARLADVSSGMAYAHGSKPPAERFIGAFAPADR